MGSMGDLEKRTGTQRRLEDILLRTKNNFDLVRLIAAFIVIFGHSFYLFPTNGWTEPVTLLVKNNFSGSLSVGIFFFISGILITQSFEKRDSLARFAILRIMRIYPAALVALFIVVFVLGPVFTTYSLKAYLTAPGTWCYIADNWHLTHLLPLPSGCFILPGVFANNHYAIGTGGIGVMGAGPNGSLWTLYPEIAAYTYTFVLGAMGFLRTPRRILATAIVLLALHATVPRVLLEFSDPQYSDTLKVGLQFLTGAVAFALRRHIILKFRYFTVLAIVAAALHGTATAEYAMYLALFYGVLVFAGAPLVCRFRLPGDYSFGVYLYGFPIQQGLQSLFPNLTSYPSNILALPLALLAGYLSWTLVEKPMLSFAHWGRMPFASRRLAALTISPQNSIYATVPSDPVPLPDHPRPTA